MVFDFFFFLRDSENAYLGGGANSRICGNDTVEQPPKMSNLGGRLCTYQLKSQPPTPGQGGDLT